MLNNILKKYRYTFILLKQLVATDFKLRYQSSFLGYIWSILKPLALFVIMYTVFTKFLKVGNSVAHFPVYLLLGLVLWGFFAEVTNSSVTSIVGKGDLLRKINFPKYIVVLSASFSAFINLGINLAVVAVLMIITGANPTGWALILMPLLIVELFILSVSVGFILSALYVKFRDIAYIWEVFMQALFYGTPIFYPVIRDLSRAIVPLRYAKVLLLNPLAQIVQDIRYLLVTQDTATAYSLNKNNGLFLVPYISVILIAVIGVRYFRNKSKTFAELV
jgi:ABC-2 type transport system permease protein